MAEGGEGLAQSRVHAAPSSSGANAPFNASASIPLSDSDPTARLKIQDIHGEIVKGVLA